MLYDDLNGAESGYIKSFGFSALIETKNKKILFDTGTKDNVLIANLTNYRISSSSIDAVVLSHNHHDHVNGLSGILESNEDLPVYVHKYWEKPVRHKGNSIPPKNKIIIEKGGKMEELGKDIYITNAYKSPDYGGIYEHSCYIRADKGFVLICGCCHPGLISFLNDREFLKIPVNTPFHLIGGFHGFKFDNDYARLIKRYIRSVILCHCTKNVNVYKHQFNEKCFIGKVGKTLTF